MPGALDLSWFSQIHTSSYRMLLSNSPDLSSPVINQGNLTDTVYTVSGLESSATYYWQVIANNAAGAGDPHPTTAE